MIRLFTDHLLAAGAALKLSEKQSHYLLHVMRAKAGDEILLFNGKDGEWRAVLETGKKDSVTTQVKTRTREQKVEPDLWLLFAPIKRGHGDLVVEKASELGVSKLLPVITQHTIVSRVPVDRYRAIATEAAEQCERLTVPFIEDEQKLSQAIDNIDKNRTIVWCAEAGDARPIAAALQALKPGPLALLIGPEGGFSEDEFKLLRGKPNILPVRLGPRILRADTAAIAALALMQGLAGDWTDID